MFRTIAFIVVCGCMLRFADSSGDHSLQPALLTSEPHLDKPVQAVKNISVIKPPTLLTKFSPEEHPHVEHNHEPALMTSKSHLDERHHIEEHMGGIVGSIEHMGEEQLKFLYFKMHDSDNNNMLDGCELVKSLLHFHVEEHMAMNPSFEGTTKIFGHDELAFMIDPILLSDDKNMDGFLDYPEFVAAQQSRGL